MRASGHPDEAVSAASVFRRLLQAVEAGELEANGPRATALLRRVEGAAAALEATVSDRPAHGPRGEVRPVTSPDAGNGADDR